MKKKFIKKNILRIVLKKKIKKEFKTFSRNTIILPKFVNYIVYIYNGKTFIKLKLVEKMVGLKFGELVFTRKIRK